MIVEELIEGLKTCPPHLLVYAEGCDCVNAVRGAGMLSSHDRGGPARSGLWLLGTGFFRGQRPPLREVRWRHGGKERPQ